ncbi:hypothetical protein BC938DRAFT_478140 [Jimgerdemannia flammicorona]|uniref:TatD family n=1 Tax=Jimgerdemannia flammicorona TaxID=994334 RepID=A0A433QYK4_9FUNG|nr:hypothetical protein BC938DRAFT_478140 [Jimgerdemannia flammicorona]
MSLEFGIHLVQKHRHKFTTGVMHSFTGKLDEMERVVALGLYLSINGCSLKTAENLEVLKRIPEDRLMIETDAPWCDIRATHASSAYLDKIPTTEAVLYAPPRKAMERFEIGCMVKSRNEPCTVGQVLHVMASVRGDDPEALAETVWKNTEKIFFPNDLVRHDSV